MGCSIFHRSFPFPTPHPQMTKTHPCPLSLLPSHLSVSPWEAQVRCLHTVTYFHLLGPGRAGPHLRSIPCGSVWLPKPGGPRLCSKQQGLDWIALKLFPWGVVRSSVDHPVKPSTAGPGPGPAWVSHRLTLSMELPSSGGWEGDFTFVTILP